MTQLKGRAVCIRCADGVDPANPNVLREIVGFDKSREAGGQNHVRFRKETGRYLCGACALRWQYAGNPAQEALPL